MPRTETISSLAHCGWRTWNLSPCTVRLKKGVVWLIPIVQDVTQEFARPIGAGGVTALHDPQGVILSAMHVDDIWHVRRMAEPEMVCGTASTHHHLPSDCVYSIQTSPDQGCVSRCYLAPPQQMSETSLRVLSWSSRQGICAELGECSLALQSADYTSLRLDCWRGGVAGGDLLLPDPVGSLA